MTINFIISCYLNTFSLSQEVSKLYLMDRQVTTEISGEVAQFLAFTMTELRSFLNMFYEEEEREADKIRTK